MTPTRKRLAAIVAAGLVGAIAMTGPLAAEGTAAAGLDGWRAAAGTADWREIDRKASLAAAQAAVMPGQDRTAVRQALGAPDQDDGAAWVYVVAPREAVSSEFRYLVVRFEGDGVTALELTDSETYTPPE